ncbi:MAG: DUF2235 domain-containing protein [Pseudomonadota bacterium]
MKRIVILCDGTWNRVDSRTPTNVVRLAQALRPVDPLGIVQVPLYIEGVGMGKGVTRTARFYDKILGGATGAGLSQNIADAYRHLVFLYEPGDEVFIFGFSRGAYTARSLTGLIRSTGIVQRDRLDLLPEAMKRYRIRDKSEVRPNSEASFMHRLQMSPRVVTSQEEAQWREKEGFADAKQPPHLLKISFLGVWDTVGALGVPRHLSVAGLFNRNKYEFHDADLSSMVTSARHAVALDETRPSFEPTRWANIERLNREHPAQPAAFQEKFFLGDHGSVGGGGDITALSNIALSWVIEGAQEAKLNFDARALQNFRRGQDPMGPLMNLSRPLTLVEKALRLGAKDRKGPSELNEVHKSVLQRIRGSQPLGDAEPYQPGSLAQLNTKALETAALELAADNEDMLA